MRAGSPGSDMQQAVQARTHDVACAPAVCGQHRCSRRQRLDHGDAEVLLTHVDEAGRAGEQPGQPLALHPAEELDVRGQRRPHLALERADPDHGQPELRKLPECRGHLERALVRHQAVDPEEVGQVALDPAREVADRHGRRHHHRLAPVEGRDPLSHGRRGCDVHVGALGGTPVPVAQPAAQRPQCHALRAPHPPLLGRRHPDVAHGRVAVADLQGAGTRARAGRARVR